MSGLYERSADDAARFVLGTDGRDPLVFLGLNPSTARPAQPDQTAARVERVAMSHGFDGVILLNLYPLRDSSPRGLPPSPDRALVTENEQRIAATVAGRALTAYAAWGAIIRVRPWFPALLSGILALPEFSAIRWTRRGPLSAGIHPRHPLYVRADEPLIPFDVHAYLRTLESIGARRRRTGA